ncbi:MAG: hypothetical protein JWR09_5014 [Mucilaginibacter sp.]|nr:hypothetical protein [Mucilaginibacter sp.]
MIERHWKGLAKVEEAYNYEQHLKKETFIKLASLNGFVSAKILKREVPGGVDFLIITVWQSMEAIQQFAGNDVDVAVVPDAVSEMMVSFDKTALHYEVVK